MAYLAGTFSMMIGLVVAGPWLTAMAARLSARLTVRPAGLLAARRLGDDPHTAFRAVSGVVLAVFVGSCAIGIITTVVANDGGHADDSPTDRGTLVHEQERIGPGGDAMAGFDDAARAELLATPGIDGITLLRGGRDQPVGAERRPTTARRVRRTGDDPGPRGLCGGCGDRRGRAPARRRRPRPQPVDGRHHVAGGRRHARGAHGPACQHGRRRDRRDARPPWNAARTVLERHIPATFAPQTIAEIRARNADEINRVQRLADIVLLASLPIAGCSLAVNVVGGLAERRRPFSLLRLTGVPLSTLRRVIALEATVPLLVSVIVAAGSGFAAAGLFVRAQLDQALEPPGALYYVLLLAGVAASLAVVASTLPLLASTTGPDSARQD